MAGFANLINRQIQQYGGGNAPMPSVQPTAGLSASVQPQMQAQPYMHPVHRFNQAPIQGGSNVFQRLAAMNQQPAQAQGYGSQLSQYAAGIHGSVGQPGMTHMGPGSGLAGWGNQTGQFGGGSFMRGRQPMAQPGKGGAGGQGKGGGIASLGNQIGSLGMNNASGGSMGAGYREQSKPGMWHGGYVRY